MREKKYIIFENNYSVCCIMLLILNYYTLLSLPKREIHLSRVDCIDQDRQRDMEELNMPHLKAKYCLRMTKESLRMVT